MTHPQSHWTIRPFQRGDALKARQLIEAVWHEHFGHHPDPFVRDFIYSRLSDIDEAETVYGDQAIFLCAVSETEIVGTGAIKHVDSRECEMTRMFVASAYRGRGIGRGIAEALIKFALGAGYDQVRLSSNEIGGFASSLRKLGLPLHIAVGSGRRVPLSLFRPADLTGLRPDDCLTAKWV